MAHASITGVSESNLGGDVPAIISANFAEDADVYSDRSHEHNGVAFSGNTLTTGAGSVVPLPAYLVGNEYVRFANDARDNGGYSATITVDVPSTFYLLVDNRVNGPAGNATSPNTTDPVLGGNLQWVIDGGWQRVNTGISPGGAPDYTGVDESGNGNGAGVGLNQFFAVYSKAAETSVSLGNNGTGGSNMVAVVVAPQAGGGPDSDNDDLTDAWELLHFGDLDEIATGDFDNDGLENFDEEQQNTDPKVKDSDGDGLEDGPEFNLHETDPADSDSDDDMLNDGLEVNTYGTNPNLADTDSDGLDDDEELNHPTDATDPKDPDSDDDGFIDGLEIAAGSDPNDDTSTPNVGSLDEVIISEFMAINETVHADAGGGFPDWVELWNTGPLPVDITGWHLTDDPLVLDKWTFPQHTMQVNAFLVVFASGDDVANPGQEFHTNFQIDGDGGFLALTRPDGNGGFEIVSQFNYGNQVEDVSFGIVDETPPPTTGFFLNPTPEALNDSNTVAGFVADTQFSIDRGMYESAFPVTITSATPGASIIFTTDSSLPTASPLNGTRVDAPDANTPPSAVVQINTTTVLRAFALKSGFQPTNVDTHSYIFATDVLQQDEPTRLYLDWGDPGPVWRMNPSVVNHASSESRCVADDLLEIPTLSIGVPFDDMWGFGGQGIYSGNGNTPNQNIEKVCSIEYLNPNGDPSDPNSGKEFQIEGTIQIVGGSSPNNFKSNHLSMRVKFTEGDLRADIFDKPWIPFGDEATDRFDTLVLDARLNQVWNHPSHSQRVKGQYVRDQYIADLQNALGGTAPHGRHMHVYVAGIYWGMHTVHERPDDNFASEYYGGDNDDYDAVKHSGNTVVNGSSANYSALSNLISQDLTNPANFAAVAEKLDLEDFAKYMLVNYYGGNTDWDHHNWYATYNRVEPGAKWHFHSWDAEHVLKDVNHNETGSPNSGKPTGFHTRLMTSPEYKLIFADLVRREFFHDGVLTPANAAALYQQRINIINEAIRAESARWGDNKRPGQPYLRGVEWLAELNNLLNNYFPSRTSVVLNQFRSAGWYPGTDAPEFGQHGGGVPDNYPLTMTSADGGVIYYTTDGSDPRLPATGGNGGPTVVELVPDNATKFAMMPTTSVDQNTWMTTGFDHSTWATGTEGAGYETSPDDYVDLIDANLHFVGQVNGSTQETIYMRIPFNASNVGDFGVMTLGVRYDDGFVAYLNGTEIMRDRAPGSAGTPLAFNANASATHSDGLAVDFQTFDVSQHVGLLQNGVNVLAVHGLNRGTGSSDMIIWPRLEASEAPTSGGAVSPTATAYPGSPVTLTDSTRVKARVLRGGEWSALTDAFFVVGAVPADATNLVVSELNYRPASPTQNEIDQGHNERTDFEFVELMNIGLNPVDLTGVVFGSGVDFEFDTDSSILVLEPGEKLLIVEDEEAFAFRYGAGMPIAGEFQNSTQFANQGEMVTLRNTTLSPPNDTIRLFHYLDDHPWPEAPDGDGFTLTLVDPMSNPDHSVPESWRSSVSVNGSPNGSDGSTLADWMTAEGVPSALSDDDSDGLQAIVEYGLRTSPSTGSSHHAPTASIETLTVGPNTDDYLTIRFRRNKAADDLVFQPMISSDLDVWSPAGAVVSVVENGDGSETVTVRSPTPVSGDRLFMLLQVSLK